MSAAHLQTPRKSSALPPLASYSPDTEITLLREQLAAAEAQLLAQRQQAVTSELTLGMLHRLNNILTGIYLIAEQGHPSHGFGAATPETAALLLASAREAREVVARTSELNTVPQAEDASYFEMGALLQRQFECVKIILPQKATVEFEAASEPLYVWINEADFRAMVFALAVQARRAIASSTHPRMQLAITPAEEFAPVISSPLTRAGEGVAMRFCGNGRGLCGNDLEQIHAQQLASKHGGSLHALPPPPRGGTEFVLLLPRVRLEDTPTDLSR